MTAAAHSVCPQHPAAAKVWFALQELALQRHGAAPNITQVARHLDAFYQNVRALLYALLDMGWATVTYNGATSAWSAAYPSRPRNDLSVAASVYARLVDLQRGSMVLGTTWEEFDRQGGRGRRGPVPAVPVSMKLSGSSVSVVVLPPVKKDPSYKKAGGLVDPVGNAVWLALTASDGMNAMDCARSFGALYNDVLKALRALEVDGWAFYDREYAVWRASAVQRVIKFPPGWVRGARERYPRTLRKGATKLGEEWPAKVLTGPLPGTDVLATPKDVIADFVLEQAKKDPIGTALLYATDAQLEAELGRRRRRLEDPLADLPNAEDAPS